jgi:hypothetical protein
MSDPFAQPAECWRCDRPAVPWKGASPTSAATLCGECQAYFARVAAAQPTPPLRVTLWEANPVELLHGLASGGLVSAMRSAAIAEFSSLGGLCGPAPGDTIN